MKKIGLFFGTFNPIHIGHLIIANHLAEFSDLDEVWLVVTPHNPHKEKKTLLNDLHRYMMVELALEDYPKLKASKIEFGLKQPNYTVITLAHLREKYPEHQFSLIMGEDNLESFHKWKNYESILENHPIYIYPRVFHNKKNNTLIKDIFASKIHKIQAPIVEISSTFIRKAIKDKKNVLPLLPLKVWQFIDKMNFYK
ncbi:MAG TPA: nicotinate-nucleotide adenylyltransferase [Flavobacteriia bacterium]|nr:nicotinate-nucleotide adenylyltransferase [Flavobacteriia bacterium]